MPRYEIKLATWPRKPLLVVSGHRAQILDDGTLVVWHKRPDGVYSVLRAWSRGNWFSVREIEPSTEKQFIACCKRASHSGWHIEARWKDGEIIMRIRPEEEPCRPYPPN